MFLDYTFVYHVMLWTGVWNSYYWFLLTETVTETMNEEVRAFRDKSEKYVWCMPAQYFSSNKLNIAKIFN